MTREGETKLIEHLEYSRSIGADYVLTDDEIEEVIKAIKQKRDNNGELAKFKDRKEQRIVTETMNALLLPLVSYWNDEAKAIVERALNLLNNIGIEE